MKMSNLIKKLVLPLSVAFVFNSKINNSESYSEENFHNFLHNKYKVAISEGFQNVKNFYYMHDDSTKLGDYWKSPIETLRDKNGDCEDLAIYFQDWLNKKGFKTKLVYGCLGSVEDNSRHIWLQYFIGKDIYVVDFVHNNEDGHIVGKNYNKKNLPEGKNYMPVKNEKYLNRNLEDYFSRNGVKLEFANTTKFSDH